VSLFYINIHFSSSVNEVQSVDTQFRTHNLILKMIEMIILSTPKIIIAFHAIKSFITYRINDFEILTITKICPVLKPNHHIERYHKIKLSQSAYISFGWNQSHVINGN